MKTVYIIAPYTKGDVAVNVKRTMELTDIVIDCGFAPFNPLLFHFQHMHCPRKYNTWMEIDKEWLLKSDFVIRLVGESVGGDIEVALACNNNIGVYTVTSEELSKVEPVYALLYRIYQSYVS